MITRVQGREERGDFKCLGCGGENCLLVGLHDGQPGREILRMIRSRRVSNAEIGAEEGGSEFGDQLDCRDCVCPAAAIPIEKLNASNDD